LATGGTWQQVLPQAKAEPVRHQANKESLYSSNCCIN
jgi:hypothetical protein